MDVPERGALQCQIFNDDIRGIQNKNQPRAFAIIIRSPAYSFAAVFLQHTAFLVFSPEQVPPIFPLAVNQALAADLHTALVTNID
ncbi:hypothetical protein D3C75_547380 [compost metagenome]